MPALVLAAPAKINLHLEILGRRSDGFHELETVFQSLELHDVVTLATGLEPGIRLVCDDPTLPGGERNLAWRAAAAVRERRPELTGIEIRLEKRLPHGAGLGGGSSDAAAVLRALQKLLREPLGEAELGGVALAIGSDVPFFLVGGAAHGGGRGERLTPLPDPPPLPVTVLMPASGLATPAVFAALTDVERGPRPPRGADWWRDRIAAPAGFLANRLTAPAARLSTEVRDLLAWLRAQNVPHLLSGSGSACFALAHLDPPTGVRAWQTRFRPRARLNAVEEGVRG